MAKGKEKGMGYRVWGMGKRKKLSVFFGFLEKALYLCRIF
jgi:hypothetical protein